MGSFRASQTSAKPWPFANVSQAGEMARLLVPKPDAVAVQRRAHLRDEREEGSVNGLKAAGLEPPPFSPG